MNEKNIIINVFKPKGITSQGVVTAVKRELGVKTAGHCGTLDPMATGVLPVMVERAVKASQYLVDHDKLYVAKMKLGIVTDTGDVTGNVLKTYDGVLPSVLDVVGVLPRFVGEIIQVPPMYSALKVGGQKLCDLARKGVEVEREGRKITVYSLSAEADGDEIRLKVLCSRGTYIRTLIEDIGNALGCGATMSSLCRSAVGNVIILNDGNFCKSENLEEKTNGNYCALGETEKITDGNYCVIGKMEKITDGNCCVIENPEEKAFHPMFSEENAVCLEELKNGIVPQKSITTLEEVFFQYPPLSFPEFYEKLFSNGCEIYISKLEKTNPAKNAKVGDVFRIIGKDGFFALGEVREYENGLAVKQIKRF